MNDTSSTVEMQSKISEKSPLVNREKGPRGKNSARTPRRASVEDAKGSSDVLCHAIENAVPPLDPETIKMVHGVIQEHGLALIDAAHMDHDCLASLGISDPIARARLLAVAKSKPRAPPPKRNGQPVQVSCLFGVQMLKNISTVDQTADIRLFVDCYWHDPSMIGVSPKFIPDYVWRPDLTVQNGIRKCEKTNHPLKLVDQSTGKMHLAVEIGVTVDNPMDLADFPFDEDALKLILLQAEDDSPNDYVLVEHESHEDQVKCYTHLETNTEFEILGFSTNYYVTSGLFSFSHVRVWFHLRRRSMYYFWKVVFPLFLSTVFSFTSFLYDRNEISERNGTAITMFLATVALLFVVNSALPKTSYLTHIDKYVLVSLLTQCAVALCSWITARSLVSLEADTADTIDWAAKIAIPSAYLFATMAFFAPSILKGVFRSADSCPTYPMEGEEGTGPLTFYPFVQGVNVFF